jgi:NADPH:quinone reductase-like Zn-dependent oxidoreductase
MNTILNTIEQISMNPMLWIFATVVYLICAAVIGEVFLPRWREVGIWAPIGLLAALAMRPYPKAPDAQPAAATPVTGITQVAAVSRQYEFELLDGKYHRPTCERLHGRLGEAVPVTWASVDAEHACPDCCPHE